MTFRSIAYKMFKANVKRYKLFTYCNLVAIAILYSFLSISQNQQFMDGKIVDPMISSNIYAPTFLVLMFCGIFIPYSQSVFIKSRQKDYGILLTLGMTEKETIESVLIENIILCVVALIGGLIVGTVLSLLFLGFIRNIIGIRDLNISISIISYKWTIFYSLIIISISLFFNILGMVKSTILNKIKLTVKAESSTHHSMLFIKLGLVLTIIAFILMIFLYKVNSNIWIVSLLFCIAGSLMVFLNGEAIIENYKAKSYKKYLKHLFLLSDVRYYYGKNKKIFFVNTWLYFAILFFITFSLVTYPNFTNNVVKYHPYHMVYTEVNDLFNPLSDDEIELIAKNNRNGIAFADTVKFVRNNYFTVFCVEDINQTMKKNYEVKPNSFILVHPYYINDGYEHVINDITDITIKFKNKEKQFMQQDTLIDPLLGNINCISNKIILVNRNDFEWIFLNSADFNIKGILHLYNFSKWKYSNKIVNEVKIKLLEKNPVAKGDNFYKVSSRIESYQTALRSSNFLIFIVIYACFLLYFAAIIMVHFKLKMEYKDEAKKYFSLYRIGIRQIEIKKIVSQKILMIYFISFIYATIINILYSYYTNCSYGYGTVGIYYSLLISLVLLIIHFIVCKVYIRNYYKNIISAMG